MLRGNSDGTIVIFVSDFEQFQDQEKKRDEILTKLWLCLTECQFTRKMPAKMEVQKSPSGLTFQLSTRWQNITFKVLPAYNALGELLLGVWTALVWRGVLREQSQRKGCQTAMGSLGLGMG